MEIPSGAWERRTQINQKKKVLTNFTPLTLSPKKKKAQKTKAKKKTKKNQFLHFEFLHHIFGKSPLPAPEKKKEEEVEENLQTQINSESLL